MRGGTGNDSLFGGNAGDSIYGGTGLDSIVGGTGADTIRGGKHSDIIDAGAGNDLIHGDDGDDSIQGGTGNDLLFGDAGNDVLQGNAGADTLHGGDGNNSFIESQTGDTLTDTIDYSDLHQPIILTHNNLIHHGTFADVVFNQFSTLIGTPFDDVLRTISVHKYIGQDYTLLPAFHIFRAGDGNDTLISTRGADALLDGGPGTDTFLPSPLSHDTIIPGPN